MPTAWPSSSTMMVSAYRMEEARWDTMNTVGPPSISRMARRSLASVAKSKALALSSRMRISGLRTKARAMVSRWRWPPEKFLPP